MKLGQIDNFDRFWESFQKQTKILGVNFCQ